MSEATPLMVGRNVAIDDIASYIIIEPPPLCGAFEFDPVLPNELRRYGVDEIQFANVVAAIQSSLFAKLNFVTNRIHNMLKYVLRACARLKFWVFSILWILLTTSGTVTGIVVIVQYGDIMILVLILAYLLPFAVLTILFGSAFGCWCRLSTFNGLEDQLEAFNTDDYTWHVRSPPVTCGQMELKRCVVQVVPRPSALLRRAEAGETELGVGDEEDDGEVIVATTDEDACVICFDHRISTRVQPCEHKILCGRCAKKVKQCPMCRSPISNVLKEAFETKATDEARVELDTV